MVAAPVKLLVWQGYRGAVTGRERAHGEAGWLSPQTACNRDGARRSGVGRPLQTSWYVQRAEAAVMFGNGKPERAGIAVVSVLSESTMHASVQCFRVL